MTVGHIISDSRSAVTTSCGPGKTGDIYEKIWNGGDRVEGELTNEHPYTCSVYERSDPSITWSLTSNPNTSYTGTFGSCFGFLPQGESSWDDNDELKLINKAASKIRGSSFNLGNFIGESRQTITLIADTATRIAKGLHYLRNGNFYKAGQQLGTQVGAGHVLGRKFRQSTRVHVNEFASAVLEYQYGWRPLLADVHDAAHTLAQRLEVPFSTTYRVRRNVNSTSSVTGGGGVLGTSLVSRSVGLKIVLKTQPTLNTALHLNDPLSVMWEVLPWSFVIDWFLPISDYLGAHDFYRNFDIAYIVRSDKTVKTVSYAGPGPNYIIDGAESYRNVEVYFTRTIKSSSFSSNIPVPSFKPMHKALSPEHLLNATALLVVTRERIRKSLKF